MVTKKELLDAINGQSTEFKKYVLLMEDLRNATQVLRDVLLEEKTVLQKKKTYWTTYRRAQQSKKIKAAWERRKTTVSSNPVFTGSAVTLRISPHTGKPVRKYNKKAGK